MELIGFLPARSARLEQPRREPRRAGDSREGAHGRTSRSCSGASGRTQARGEQGGAFTGCCFVAQCNQLSAAMPFLFERINDETELLLPDNLRGRVSTTDRATETRLEFLHRSCWLSLRAITPRTLTVISGLLSATSGIVWLVLFASRRVRLPRRLNPGRDSGQASVLPVASCDHGRV
jgi:hypothetical protein